MSHHWLAILAVGFIPGFSLGFFLSLSPVTKAVPPLNSLRLEGFNYISPLLACDTRYPQHSTKLDSLKSQLNHLIQQHQTNNQVDALSIYVRQFQTGDTLALNPEEKFNPGSLIKIPLMIAVYQQSQLEPDFLSTQFTYTLPDHNQGQEIAPQLTLQSNQNYTLEDALGLLIKYSDNNAYWLLTKYLDLEDYTATYKDLKISLAEASDSKDYLTVEDFSYFFRILYNATYLNKEYSQKALQLLSQSVYHNGLVSGLPPNTIIAHKFGLKSFTEGGIITKRELHDCGIVYLPNNPYLICVMTKSRAPIAGIESVLKSISAATYQAITASVLE